MPRPGTPFRPRLLASSLLVSSLVILGLSGCSGTPVGEASSPSPQPTVTTNPSAPTIPAGGVSLATLGFVHGPRQAFSVPEDAFVTASSDQSSLVTLVLAAPAPHQVYDYLITALPQAGFTVTGHNGASQTPALSFTGQGWIGNFTGNGSTSAVTLRPAG